MHAQLMIDLASTLIVAQMLKFFMHAQLY
jgi:hypothetical protein